MRAAVTPQIVINDPQDQDDTTGKIVFRAPETNGEDVLTVLDRTQQNLAMHLGDGYRVIRGVAGSGKTLVLTYRARFLAEADPGRRILLTCFNRTLAAALAYQLDDLTNVEVRSLDSLAYATCRESGINIKGTQDDFRERRLAARKALEQAPAAQRFDVVLVDEAQDFDNAAFDLAYAALKSGAQDFIVALDAAQNGYRKRGRWNPPGTTARGRTTVMRVHYRNTKEILDLAYGVLSRGGEVKEGEGGLDDQSVVVAPEATHRRGLVPRVTQIADRRDEIRLLCERIEALHDHGISWSDIVVLYGSKKVGRRVFGGLNDCGVPYYDIAFNSRQRSGVMTCGDKVRGATLQTMKGLESSHVLICGVNDIWAGGDDDEVARRRLLYVGMTRATDVLEVFIAGDGALGADVLDAASAAA